MRSLRLCHTSPSEAGFCSLLRLRVVFSCARFPNEVGLLTPFTSHPAIASLNKRAGRAAEKQYPPPDRETENGEKTEVTRFPVASLPDAVPRHQIINGRSADAEQLRGLDDIAVDPCQRLDERLLARVVARLAQVDRLLFL
jgi:hypothetical protein